MDRPDVLEDPNYVGGAPFAGTSAAAADQTDRWHAVALQSRHRSFRRLR